MDVTILSTFLRPILTVALVWNTEKLVTCIQLMNDSDNECLQNSDKSSKIWVIFIQLVCLVTSHDTKKSDILMNPDFGLWYSDDNFCFKSEKCWNFRLQKTGIEKWRFTSSTLFVQMKCWKKNSNGIRDYCSK